MAHQHTCDICFCVVKDQPIFIGIGSDNKIFGEPTPTRESFMPFPGLMPHRDWVCEEHLELCEVCGSALLNVLDSARKNGLMRKQEIEKFK